METYTFSKRGLDSFKDWIAQGHLQYIKSQELSVSNYGMVPMISCASFLFMMYSDPSFPVTVVTVYTLWLTLSWSVAVFVFLYFRLPRNLRELANKRADDEMRDMLFEAYVRSEISEMTGE
jgi:hypothetical protein